MIYIPIRGYSNRYLFKALDITSNKFTFQSGDIQTLETLQKLEFYHIFTFQSGDIQMILSIMNEYASGKFTFQSGDIQIHSVRRKINLL